MGMSTRVIAFISDQDTAYKKHAKVLIACYEANVSLPKETADYFGSFVAELYLLEEKLEIEIPMTEWRNDYCEGFELFVSDIPSGTHKIRFYNSW